MATEKIKWYSPESLNPETQTRELKQHAIIPRKSTGYESYVRGDEGGLYEANRYACKSRSGLIDEYEVSAPFKGVESQVFNKSKACKRCLKIIGNKKA